MSAQTIRRVRVHMGEGLAGQRDVGTGQRRKARTVQIVNWTARTHLRSGQSSGNIIGGALPELHRHRLDVGNS